MTNFERFLESVLKPFDGRIMFEGDLLVSKREWLAMGKALKEATGMAKAGMVRYHNSVCERPDVAKCLCKCSNESLWFQAQEKRFAEFGEGE